MVSMFAGGQPRAAAVTLQSGPRTMKDHPRARQLPSRTDRLAIHDGSVCVNITFKKSVSRSLDPSERLALLPSGNHTERRSPQRPCKLLELFWVYGTIGACGLLQLAFHRTRHVLCSELLQGWPSANPVQQCPAECKIVSVRLALQSGNTELTKT